MDLKELRYIVTIAEEQSISGAAEKLYMAQSSLSQFLKQYEAELGVRLFVRTSRGVRPTTAGTAFLSHARLILRQYRLACSDIMDTERLNSGEISLGISPSRNLYLLPPVLVKFRQLYPNVHVDIAELNINVLNQHLTEGTLDVILASASSLPVIPQQCPMDFLLSDEVLIVAAKNHPVMQFARRDADNPDRQWINFEDAAQFEFILGGPRTPLGAIARQEFHAINRIPRAVTANVSFLFAAAMARAGLALALTYRSAVENTADAEYLSIGPSGIYSDLLLVYPADGYRSKATVAFCDLMKKMCQTSGSAPK